MIIPTYAFEATLGGVLSLFITVILPLLVGLVTRFSWSSGVKAVVLLVLTAVKTIVEAAIFAGNEGTPFQFYPILLTGLGNLVVAIAIHFGVWKPTPIGEAAARAGVQ